MKKFLLVALMLLIGSGLYAQGRDVTSSEVPENVHAAFSQRFAKATDIEWEELNGDYRASFEAGHVDHEAAFTSAGKFLSHSYDISGNEVPTAVQSAFKQKFSKATDVEWERETGIKKEEEKYRVSFEINNKDHEVFFTSDGQLRKHAFDIAKKDLPATVAAKLRQDFPHYRIDDLSRVMVVEGKKREKISYKIELDGQPDLMVRYNKKGRLLEKMVED